ASQIQLPPALSRPISGRSPSSPFRDSPGQGSNSRVPCPCLCIPVMNHKGCVAHPFLVLRLPAVGSRGQNVLFFSVCEIRFERLDGLPSCPFGKYAGIDPQALQPLLG